MTSTKTPAVRRATTLIELIITLMLIAILGTAMTMVMEGGSGWSATASSEDALAEDVLGVWKTMNDDLAQSAWFIPDSTQSFGTASLVNDRSLFYAPYVLQPSVTSAPTNGQATNASLTIFNRSSAGDQRFEGSGVADLDRCVGLIPGTPADRMLAPMAATYATSYFARSQELVFVRATSTAWNRTANAPMNLMSTSLRPPPVELFPGTTSDWMTPANHTAIGALRPSGWQRSGTTWTQISPSAPYGQVMDACYLYTSGGTTDLKLQLEQKVQPDFTTQSPANVRLFSYAVVPCPIGRGLGRLVRVYSANGTVGTSGVEIGQRIASDGASSLVVDKVLSDNVIRVVFDSARHSDAIGVNNIRATIYFAKPVEKNRLQSAVIHRSVTMIFALRAANTYQDKADTRALIKTSPVFATGAIPFSY